jgi:hypothetical protein
MSVVLVPLQAVVLMVLVVLTVVAPEVTGHHVRSGRQVAVEHRIFASVVLHFQIE